LLAVQLHIILLRQHIHLAYESPKERARITPGSLF